MGPSFKSPPERQIDGKITLIRFCLTQTLKKSINLFFIEVTALMLVEIGRLIIIAGYLEILSSLRCNFFTVDRKTS